MTEFGMQVAIFQTKRLHFQGTGKLMNMKISFFSILIPMITGFLLYPLQIFANDNPVLTHGQLVKTIAYSQPNNPYLPRNFKTLPQRELFVRTQKIMEKQGVDVLEGKNVETPLSNLEFLHVVYAFSRGPANRSLIDQKLFLKNNDLISATDIGLATGVRGEVIQFHENSKFGNPVGLASPLFQYDKISTSRKSRAAFTLDDRSQVILSGGSTISIDKNIYDPDKRFRQMLFRMSKGAARFVVSKSMKKGSSFTVITPNGVAGVRGTEFVTLVDPNEETRFVVLEGKIETAPRLPNGKWGTRSFIRAGEMQSMFKGGKFSKVTKVPRRLLQKIEKNIQVPREEKKHTLLRQAKATNKNSNHHVKDPADRSNQLKNYQSVQKNSLNQELTKADLPQAHSLDREMVNTFKKLSTPSKLDAFRSNYKERLSQRAFDKLKQP